MFKKISSLLEHMCGCCVAGDRISCIPVKLIATVADVLGCNYGTTMERPYCLSSPHVSTFWDNSVTGSAVLHASKVIPLQKKIWIMIVILQAPCVQFATKMFFGLAPLLWKLLWHCVHSFWVHAFLQTATSSWVSAEMGDCSQLYCQARHPGQLNLAIPPRVDKMRTDDSCSHR